MRQRFPFHAREASELWEYGDGLVPVGPTQTATKSERRKEKNEHVLRNGADRLEIRTTDAGLTEKEV